MHLFSNLMIKKKRKRNLLNELNLPHPELTKNCVSSPPKLYHISVPLSPLLDYELLESGYSLTEQIFTEPILIPDNILGIGDTTEQNMELKFHWGWAEYTNK